MSIRGTWKNFKTPTVKQHAASKCGYFWNYMNCLLFKGYSFQTEIDGAIIFTSINNTLQEL